jgi:hypothetical protein
VRAQPVGEDLGGAVVDQVNGPVRFQIQQQRPIAALSLSQCDIAMARWLGGLIILDEQHLRLGRTEFVQYYNLARPCRARLLDSSR